MSIDFYQSACPFPFVKPHIDCCGWHRVEISISVRIKGSWINRCIAFTYIA